VPIPINGSTQHTGKLPDDSHVLESAVKSDACHAASEYRSTYKADAANYNPPGRTGGGFWFEEQQRKAAGGSAATQKNTAGVSCTHGSFNIMPIVGTRQTLPTICRQQALLRKQQSLLR
jgi:hypothetical protein